MLTGTNGGSVSIVGGMVQSVPKFIGSGFHKKGSLSVKIKLRSREVYQYDRRIESVGYVISTNMLDLASLLVALGEKVVNNFSRACWKALFECIRIRL